MIRLGQGVVAFDPLAPCERRIISPCMTLAVSLHGSLRPAATRERPNGGPALDLFQTTPTSAVP